jgi:hypothetical protein
MIPNTKINRLDNQIGVVPPQTGDRLAVVGPASSGPIDTPTLCWTTTDVTGTFGALGPSVEAACYEIATTGRPVLFCRTGATTVGGYLNLDVTGVTGTSVATNNVATEPFDDAEMLFEVVTGGTIGSAGITYRYSDDDGRSFSGILPLGTAVFIVLPGNSRINFAAGTLVAGDRVKYRTTAPKWSTAQLTSALTAVRNSLEVVQIVEVCGPIADNTEFGIVHAAAALFESVGREVLFVCSTRTPTLGETEAAYKTALDTAFAGSTSDFISLWAGSCEVLSCVSFRSVSRRPPAHVTASRIVDIRAGKDPASKDLGSLPLCSIADARRNPKHHDERLNPGLDDSRFSTLRTWADKGSAVYINNARLMSASGSDFVYVPSIRVMNKGAKIVREVLDRRSSGDFLVDRTTGFVIEDEASDVDTDVNSALDEQLVKPREASGATFTLNRTDNLLATFKLKGKMQAIPLGYLKQAEIDVAYFNPARSVNLIAV